MAIFAIHGQHRGKEHGGKLGQPFNVGEKISTSSLHDASTLGPWRGPLGSKQLCGSMLFGDPDSVKAGFALFLAALEVTLTHAEPVHPEGGARRHPFGLLWRISPRESLALLYWDKSEDFSFSVPPLKGMLHAKFSGLLFARSLDRILMGPACAAMIEAGKAPAVLEQAAGDVTASRQHTHAYGSYLDFDESLAHNNDSPWLIFDPQATRSQNMELAQLAIAALFCDIMPKDWSIQPGQAVPNIGHIMESPLLALQENFRISLATPLGSPPQKSTHRL